MKFRPFTPAATSQAKRSRSPSDRSDAPIDESGSELEGDISQALPEHDEAGESLDVTNIETDELESPAAEYNATAVIEEKHHLEARAGWPSGVVAALGVGAAVLIVQDPSNTVDGGRLWWLTSELLTLAVCSAIWTVWCVHRASRLAVGQRQLHRGPQG